jgi:protoporphyrinogen oxidase
MEHSQFLIIGAGISGLSVAKMLQEQKRDYLILEKSDRPGGLVKCDVVDGHLFHRVGGHVFNTKIPDVGDWFWSHFDRESEFLKANRNAAIKMGEKMLGYPIENYLYMLDEQISRKIFRELIDLSAKGITNPMNYKNFESFLLGSFGETLYKLYFEPYNNKIWQTSLSDVALPWLEGKLPMPETLNIIMSNILRKPDSEMVHSQFFYPCQGGSQFIVNRLAEKLNLRTGTGVESIERKGKNWLVNGQYSAEHIIYTGDIRRLSSLTNPDDRNTQIQLEGLQNLLSNGTSNLLCETDETALSWLYLPGKETPAHRIIFTGNFSKENNPSSGRRSCTVEFSGKTSTEEMKKSLQKLPFNLKYIDHNYEPNSYVIQRNGDRERIAALKNLLTKQNFHLVGRFAEWEYHNMDKAMESGMKVLKTILS